VALSGTHRGTALPSGGTWVEAGLLLAGTPAAPLALLVGGLALRGAFVLYRRDRAFLGYVSVIAAVHVAAIVFLRPVKVDHALVLARYLLVLLPFALALVALGAAEPLAAAALRRGRLAQGAAMVLLLGALLATGPLATPAFWESPFLHHPSFMRFTRPMPRARQPSAFYREHTSREGEIVEFPWMNVGSLALVALRETHHAPVRVAPGDARLLDPRLDLRNVVAPTPEAFERASARFVVVHVDLGAEAARMVPPGDRAPGSPADWQLVRRLGLEMATRLRRAWGPPIFSDRSIEVWDMHLLQESTRG
jgi:hypothetical protein